MEAVAWTALVAALLAGGLAGITAVVLWKLAAEDIRYLLKYTKAHKANQKAAAEAGPQVVSAAEFLAQRADPDTAYSMAPKEPAPPFDPPMVDDQTLHDWLVHSWENRPGIWASLVDDFYVRCWRNANIQPYFVGRNVPEIKRKFLATLLIITQIGVSEAAAKNLADRHIGLGIDGRAYDETINELIASLRSYNVSMETIQQMVPMLGYMRNLLVTA